MYEERGLGNSSRIQLPVCSASSTRGVQLPCSDTWEPWSRLLSILGLRYASQHGAQILHHLLRELSSRVVFIVCGYVLQVIPTANDPRMLEPQLESGRYLILGTPLHKKNITAFATSSTVALNWRFHPFTLAFADMFS